MWIFTFETESTRIENILQFVWNFKSNANESAFWRSGLRVLSELRGRLFLINSLFDQVTTHIHTHLWSESIDFIFSSQPVRSNFPPSRWASRKTTLTRWNDDSHISRFIWNSICIFLLLIYLERRRLADQLINRCLFRWENAFIMRGLFWMNCCRYRLPEDSVTECDRLSAILSSETIFDNFHLNCPSWVCREQPVKIVKGQKILIGRIDNFTVDW